MDRFNNNIPISFLIYSQEGKKNDPSIPPNAHTHAHTHTHAHPHTQSHNRG